MCANTLINAEDGQACVEFDADTGAVPPEAPLSASHQQTMPTSLADTITGWIQMLHMERMFTHEDFRLRDGFGDYPAVSDGRLYLAKETLGCTTQT